MSQLVIKWLGVNLKVLKFLRLYSTEKQTCVDKVCTYVLYFTLMLQIPVFGSLYFILEEEIDMKDVGDNAFVLLLMWAYFAKFLPFLANREKIVECIHFLDHLNVKLNKKQEEMLNESGRICKRNTKIFLTSAIAGLASFATKPIRLSTDKFPVDVWLPFDPTHNRIVFWCGYVYFALGVGYPGMASGAAEPLVAGLAGFASGHLRVLKDDLEFLEEYAETERMKNLECDEVKSNVILRKIRQCVDHHNSILTFAKEFEVCFSQVVFSQFVGSMLVICFCCYYLSMLETFSMEFLSTINYLFVLLAQVYFYCFYGTELFDESDSITRAIYMSPWYKYDLKCRKCLLLMMERSKKPIVITAGKFFDLSLDTFTTIIRRSYSLLAVLNNQK